MRISIVCFCTLLLTLTVAADPKIPMLLRATYTPVPGSDREYGQGAIERWELAHREIRPNVWLIRVPDEAGTDVWQKRLTDAARGHGTFGVAEASAEERRRVESGEITLQK